MEAETSDVEDATSHIEAATADSSSVTTHTTPGAIKPHFQSTVTAHEKGEVIFKQLRRKQGKVYSETG